MTEHLFPLITWSLLLGRPMMVLSHSNLLPLFLEELDTRFQTIRWLSSLTL